MWIMEQNFEFSPIRANLERQNFWNPDAIRTKSDKIWLPLSGHKWLAAIRVPHLYSGVLSLLDAVRCGGVSGRRIGHEGRSRTPPSMRKVRAGRRTMMWRCSSSAPSVNNFDSWPPGFSSLLLRISSFALIDLSGSKSIARAISNFQNMRWSLSMRQICNYLLSRRSTSISSNVCFFSSLKMSGSPAEYHNIVVYDWNPHVGNPTATFAPRWGLVVSGSL
jgi:hypothetical protein